MSEDTGQVIHIHYGSEITFSFAVFNNYPDTSGTLEKGSGQKRYPGVHPLR